MKGPAAPPWNPLTSSWATVFLLPLAGALVAGVNLLRMGRPDKALFAVATGLASTLLVLALWLQGRAWLDRLFWTLFITAAGDTGLFLYLQLAEYQAWRRRHPGAEPAGGWGAAIWALIGFTLTLLIWGGAILGLVLLRPSRAA